MFVNLSHVIIPDEPSHEVCLFVDNTQAAQNNEFPYSEWEINDYNVDYSFVDECNLNVETPTQLSVSIHPNPVGEVLNINAGDALVDKIILYDNLGRQVLEETDTTEIISISHLVAGFYVLKIFSGRAVHTEKIIIKR